MFADDTNILITSPNPNDFQIITNTTLNCVNEWLTVNLLSINFDKTHYIQFTNNNKPITHTEIALQQQTNYSHIQHYISWAIYKRIQ